jgi:hypothetical protein
VAAAVSVCAGCVRLLIYSVSPLPVLDGTLANQREITEICVRKILRIFDPQTAEGKDYCFGTAVPAKIASGCPRPVGFWRA